MRPFDCSKRLTWLNWTRNPLPKDYEAGDSAQRIIYSYHDLECLTVYAAEQYFNLSHNAISLLGYPEGLRIETPPPILVSLVLVTCI